ncbi:subtilisin-like protease SBT3 [Lathyrus oleraceus]|uniref:subtilisin-like protease SBT3 n=1 Tax=Pisum sativum TaxID=3888 RepID=UPI0021D16AFE|nr:subtilisin-like protease SBT3 [Pisum sativum]
MASNMCLLLLLSYITTSLHFITFTLAHYDNYIIHMDLSTMPKTFSNQHDWYHSTLSQVTTSNNNLNSSPSKMIYTYSNVMNGFSANLSPQDHESLKKTPGYISSIPDLTLKLHTTYSPQFLGLNPYKGAWPSSEYGKDVIIGLVDTGVWPEHESFKDDGMTEIPSKWKGQLCQFDDSDHSSLCNKKLIGARYFNKGFLAMFPNESSTIMNNTRDVQGHGTLTSSIAAGSKIDGASYFGYANGTARGIASMSRVAMYKTTARNYGGAVASDIMAAIDAAISDGVDVLSISMGADEIPFYEDTTAIATFAAMEKGIFVSVSAGNQGSPFQTLQNAAPWFTSVGAGTLDREFQGVLTLDNGVSFTGLSWYPGNFSATNFPIIFMGMCENITELNKLKSNIIVCEDNNGTLLGTQIYNMVKAKVAAGVFISITPNILDSDNRIPSIIINPVYGEIIQSYIKSHNSKNSTSIASLTFKTTGFGVKPSPRVDFYSSRGPSRSCPYVLKPDITAPGSNILASWPINVPVGIFEDRELFNNFNIASGTSLSCPHVAGVGALLKGAHNDWSPAAIRSAIMTTSYILDNTKKHIKAIEAIGYGNEVGTPLALGAGHLDPNKALDPGLVYDVGVQDYVNLLCALNYSQKNIATITRSTFNDCSKPSLDLNYPSFIAFSDDKNSSSRIIQQFSRTVTNVGEGQTTYVAHITPIKGFNISVIPNKLVFNHKNEKISFKLKIEGPLMKQKNDIAFGYLTWEDGKHVVRSPIVATSPNFD